MMHIAVSTEIVRIRAILIIYHFFIGSLLLTSVFNMITFSKPQFPVINVGVVVKLTSKGTTSHFYGHKQGLPVF